MEYFNLALNIKAAGDAFEIVAESETMGETSGRLVLPFEAKELAEAQERLGSGAIDTAFLTAFGSRLCDALFAGSVRDLYRECLGEVHRDDERGVRLRLCIEPPSLSAIPWELTYDQSRDVFLATSSETPLTRYLSVHEPIDELRTAPPVSVLVAIPDGTGLDVAMERATIEDALSDLGDAVSVTVLDGRVTRSAISHALLQRRHHVFHFIGHGDFDGTDGHLFLNADEGHEDDAIQAKAFAGFFRDYPSMKLVVLNACQGAAVSRTQPLAGIAPQLVRGGVPAVVAMQYPFPDNAALLFAREFYARLCSGTDRGRVDTAISHARNRLQMDFSQTPAFATPVLYMRSPSGVIFDLESGEPRRVLLPRADIHRLKAVRKAHEANIAARKTGEAASDAQAIGADGAQIAAIDRRIRSYYLTIAGLVAGSWLVLFASWIGLFNAIKLDAAIEQAFVGYMDGFVATPVDSRVSIVLASGEASENGPLGAIGTSEWRCHHARLLDGLSAAGALVVAFDLFFEDASPCDAPFAEAIGRARARGTRIVLGVRRHDVENGVVKPRMALALLAAVQDGWGLLDGDPTSRRVRLGAPPTSTTSLHLDEHESSVVPSFALRTLMHVESAARGGAPVAAALDRGDDVLRLRDAERTALRSIPLADPSMFMLVGLASREDLAPAAYHDVLTSASLPDGLSRFARAIVIVGYESSEDQLILGGSSGSRRYGAELQASAISNLLQGIVTRPASTAWQYLVILLMGIVGVVIGWRFPAPRRRQGRAPWPLPIPLFVAIAVYALSAFLMYKQYRLIFDISYHVASLLFMYAMTVWVRRSPARA